MQLVGYLVQLELVQVAAESVATVTQLVGHLRACAACGVSSMERVGEAESGRVGKLVFDQVNPF